MINQFIVQGSDKWSESIYNEDQDFKYVSMLRSDNDATNLPQVRGTGEEHFRYFVENRLNYCDSKWYAGDYPEDNAIVRIYTPVDAEGVPKTDLVIPANADITVTPYSAMYAGVRYKANGTLYQERLEENETYTFEAPNEIFNDTETAIYGASQLSSLGDLAPLYLGYIDVGAATKLVELKIGDGTPGYLNSNLYHLAVGTNRLLKKIDIQNCAGPKFSQALVLSGCPNIEEVYAKGSSITGVDLPESGYLKILQLPATIANLTLKNQPYLNDLTIEGLTNLKTITIENTPVDTLSILSGATNVERVRLTNVDWHHEDASILYELINRDIGGIDENGVNTDTMWIDGKCHIEELTGNELLEIKTLYPYLDITYTTLESQIIYMSEDGQTELTRKTIYNGGNDSCPVESGAIERPTKESTAQYDYEFNGWSLTPGGQADDNALIKIEANRQVYAAFKKSIRYYTVGFYDNNTLLSSVQTTYGKNAVPCKKNLFNINSFNMNKVINNGNGSLTLTNYISIGNILDKVCCNLKIGETYIWSGTNLTQIHFGGKLIISNEPFVFTQEMFDSNIIGLYAKGTTSENDPYTISNIQLELGNTVTTYEPYTTIVPTEKADVDNPEDFEFIGWKPEPTNIQGDTTCYAQWYDTREITDDWDTIAAACLDGTATEKYMIGSYKPVTIEYNKLPYAFYDGAAVVYNDEIHILGGAESMRNHYKWNGEEWVSVSELPYDFYWSSAIVYNDEIHILGTAKSGSDKKHYKYNDTEGWLEVSTLPVYFKRGGVVVYNEELHLLAGQASSKTHYKYDNEGDWIEVNILPETWYDGSAVVLDNKIHIFGGPASTTAHYVYDGNNWSILNDLPYNTLRNQAIVYKNEVHILGGDYTTDSGLKHYTMDSSGQYTEDISLPYKCSRFSTIVHNDKIHILGSYNENQRQSHYVLDNDEWTPFGDYEVINMEIIAHNHDELTDGVNKWEKVGSFYPGRRGSMFVTYNNNIHIFSGAYSKLQHYVYNGLTTTLVDNLPFEVRRAVVYNNEIHTICFDNNVRYHYKYDGSVWTEASVVSELFNGDVQLVVLDDTMYAFDNASGKGNVYKYDGASWSVFSEISDAMWNFNVYVYDNDVYMLNYTNKKYKKWNPEIGQVNLTWTLTEEAVRLVEYDSTLYALSKTKIYKLENDEWIIIDNMPKVKDVGEVIAYNNEIHFLEYGEYATSYHYKWSTAGWESKDTIVPQQLGVHSQSTDMMVINNMIYAISGTFFFKYDGEEYTVLDTPSFCNNNNVLACTDGSYIYAMSGVTDATSEHYAKIYKWDGVEWTEYCTAPYSAGNVAKMHMIWFNGELHFMGGMYAYYRTHYKYNGTEWIQLADNPSSYMIPVVFANKLYLCHGKGLWEYDSINDSYIQIAFTGRTDKEVASATVSSDALYFQLGNGSVCKWDGETLSEIPLSHDSGWIIITFFRGQLHCFGGQGGSDGFGLTGHRIFRNPRATLTFFAKEAMEDSRPFTINDKTDNDGNKGAAIGGWKLSDIRQYLHNEFYSMLSTELQSCIKPVAKLTDGGYQNPAITTTDDSIWLASYTEVGGTNSPHTPDGQGEAYSVFTDANSRMRAKADGTRYRWWLRSGHTTNADVIPIVSPGGSPYDTGYFAKEEKNVAVVFGFCI